MTGNCPYCGSNKVMKGVQVTTEPAQCPTLELRVTIETHPDALFFKGPVVGPLRARVCGGCGHTELYATNFEQLYEAYQQARGG